MTGQEVLKNGFISTLHVYCNRKSLFVLKRSTTNYVI